MTEAPNTILHCNICGEKIGEICMMSPNWSASESFISNARYHFEHEHGMKPKEDGGQGF